MPPGCKHAQIHPVASVEIIVMTGKAEATEDDGILARKVVDFVLEKDNAKVVKNLTPRSELGVPACGTF